MMIVPPPEKVTMPEVTREQRRANKIRFDQEDQIRKAYMETFAKDDGTRQGRLLSLAAGNHDVIDGFIADHPDERALEEFVVPDLAPDGRPEEDDEHDQAQNLEQLGQQVVLPQAAEDVAVGDDDAHGPSGPFDGCIVGVMLFLADQDGRFSGPAFQHGPVQGLEGQAVLQSADDVIDGLGHDHILPGTDHEQPGAAEHDGARMGIYLKLGDQVGQPVQGDVSRQDGRGAAGFIVDGERIGRHQHLSTAGIDIGFGPVAFAEFQGLGKPFPGRIVIRRGGEGTGDQAVPVPIGVRGEQGPLAVISRNQGDGGSDDDGVVPDQHLAHIGERVGMVQAPLGNPALVADGGLRLVDDVHDFALDETQAAFRPHRHLGLEGFPGKDALEERGRFQRDSRHDDQQDGGPRGLPEGKPVDEILEPHGMFTKLQLFLIHSSY